MVDHLRPVAYYVFVTTIVGGLWLYADARRQIDATSDFHLGPATATYIRSVMAAEAADRKEGDERVKSTGLTGLAGLTGLSDQPREQSQLPRPVPASAVPTAVLRIDTGEAIPR
jgi:hypothetical protein